MFLKISLFANRPNTPIRAVIVVLQLLPDSSNLVEFRG